MVLAPRSGLAVKNFIDVGAGVVDYDYRGNVGVVLFNHADEDFTVHKGDRVAQLILERISMAAAEEVQELSDTVRGAGGFGSTGVVGAVTTTSQGGAAIAFTATLGELVQVKKLTDLATLPTRGSVHAAGTFSVTQKKMMYRICVHFVYCFYCRLRFEQRL